MTGPQAAGGGSALGALLYNLPVELAELLKQLLAHEPDTRPTVAAALADLRAIQAALA